VRETSEAAWWRKTRQLALATVVGLGVIGFLPALLGGVLNRRLLLGLPFGTFLAVVILPLVMLVALFVFAARQQGLDRGHDVAED
jgi:putative solute:sodium symporter small subunit